MKRFYVIVLLGMSFVIHAHGQEMTKHVVQRGETFESIAHAYNLSQQELQEANHDMEVFYTGLEINVPIPVKMSSMTSNNAESSRVDEQYLKTYAAYLEECEEADMSFEAQNYSKAQKQYRQIIKKYEGVLPCDDALYGNALCSYNREKWKSAIEDLSLVINNEECSQGTRDHCKRLLAKAQSYRDQQLENLREFWSGVALSAVELGATIAVAASQPKQSASASSSSSSISSSSSGTVGETSSSSEISTSSSLSSNSSCPSLKVHNGKYYCANTGNCGMCGGDGLMDGQYGQGPNSHKCTLCGGTGKCKYCR